jgi:Tfp pilus assembly protein PilF
VIVLRVTSRPSSPDSAQLRWTAADWFDRGSRLLEQNEVQPAIEALRMSLMDRPGDPEANFTLAEALYRQGNIGGALERYYAAVEADHEYIEVWTQIGCLYLEKGDADSALQALDVALSIHAEYPDAHLHRAEALEHLGRAVEASKHWRAYLQHDQHGPWAEKARQRLQSC